MRKLVPFALLFVLSNSLLLADPVRSGPQPGAKVPGPFRPLHVTGAHADKRVCLYCEYGMRPVAVVFAREITPAVSQLISRLDAVTVARSAETRLASYSVFLGDTEKLKAPLVQLAASNNLKQHVLTIDEQPPPSYEIADEAAFTVVLYHRAIVKANHAFRAGELNEAAIARVLADLDAMLAAK